MHQDNYAQKRMENIIKDLEKASQMSVCSSRDMPYMNIQRQMIGKPFVERQIQIYTQILFEWISIKMTTTTITMIMIIVTTIIIYTTESEVTGMISQIWEEVEKEREQLRVKVEGMNRVMKIGLKIYSAKFRDNN
ncbi:MAG: hypothetical protein EZS28_050787 [Streblomastix strix]|uniref:Uncharacterized protein n=1 Tax=Streblomastix strix TaxID=222440 RepID=A0A5J4T616_9EUKA|nr:MAG: hypothetical protein EZS28_050787 [Streblomastix strix]